MFGLHHEAWSARLVREHPDVCPLLEDSGEGTAEAVARLLEDGQAERRVIKALVSSQLDCDRLDYLMRDSYSTGARYGQLDLDRILDALPLAPDGDLAIHPVPGGPQSDVSQRLHPPSKCGVQLDARTGRASCATAGSRSGLERCRDGELALGYPFPDSR